jgi:hypothetical protein
MILSLFINTGCKFVLITQMYLLTYLWHLCARHRKATTEDGRGARKLMVRLT